jgi:hypothetical protein
VLSATLFITSAPWSCDAIPCFDVLVVSLFGCLTHQNLHGLIGILSTIYNSAWENIELIVKLPRSVSMEMTNGAAGRARLGEIAMLNYAMRLLGKRITELMLG